MTISVVCPACGNRYELEQQYAGEDVECECGKQFCVPSPAPNTGWQPLATEFDESAEILLVVCPNCSAEYDLEPDDVGAEVDCECGCTFIVPDSSGATADSAATELASLVDTTGSDAALDESSAHPSDEDEPHEPGRTPVSLLEGLKIRRLWISVAISIGLVAVASLVVVIVHNYEQPIPDGAEQAVTTRHQKPSITPPERSGRVPEQQEPPLKHAPKQPIPVVSQSETEPIPAIIDLKKEPVPTERPADALSRPQSASAVHQPGSRTQPKKTQLPQSPVVSMPIRREPKQRLPRIKWLRPKRIYRKFEDAAADGYRQFQEMEELRKKADASADQADHQKYVHKLALAGGTLLIAHQLANERTDPALVEQVRFLLADSSLLAHSFYEAAILGEAVARWADPQSDIASQAAFVALSAFLEAYETESDDKNVAEMQQMFRIARLIETRWPQHARVDDVRLQIGRMSSVRGDTARAALWFSKVSRSSKQYAESQMLAGQAYWSMYLTQSGALSNDSDHDAVANGAVAGRRSLELAEHALETGIETAQQTPLNQRSRERLYLAKLFLAEIYLRHAQHTEVVSLLTEKPNPVTVAVSMADESKRPKTGVQSRSFAVAVYQTLLMAHLGNHNLTQAQQAMSQLETLVGKNDPARMTPLYVKLGEQLSAQLQSVHDDGKRSRKLRQTMESFLTPIRQQADTLPLGIMAWLADTYTHLAESSSETAESRRFFTQAALVYKVMLDRSLPSPEAEPLFKSRLARSYRRSGDYDAALEVLTDLLRNEPNILELQFEAAYALQESGMASNDPDKLLSALQGIRADDSNLAVWGWGHTASVLQKHQFAKPDESKYADMLLEARYNIAFCRYHRAQWIEDLNRRAEELAKTEWEITGFAVIREDRDGTWWKKLDAIYQAVRRDQNKPADSLLP